MADDGRATEADGAGTPAGISRRSFFKGTGMATLGTSLLDSFSNSAHAARLEGSAPVLGPHALAVALSVNGRDITVLADPGTTLVQVLREGLGLTGTKIGCDRGACSACTVWLDGEVASSCMTLALDARGRKITTIEGLAKDETLHPVQQAFVEHDAMQCGFCTPGMVMSCAALVNRNPECTLDDVKAAVSGHLCRCGTYPNIFKATLAAAAVVRSRGTSQGGAR
jgi:xanthine dehydrogenase YagT iron-sulfur-binding subunit